MNSAAMDGAYQTVGRHSGIMNCTSCLSLRERWPSEARPERGNKGGKPSQSPSVTALPEGEPRGCIRWHEKWSVSVPIRSIRCFTTAHQRTPPHDFLPGTCGGVMQFGTGSSNPRLRQTDTFQLPRGGCGGVLGGFHHADLPQRDFLRQVDAVYGMSPVLLRRKGRRNEADP